MTNLHPEKAYEEIRMKLVALGKEYGVDITEAGGGEFLNDLYDQCYADLSDNIPEEEDED